MKKKVLLPFEDKPYSQMYHHIAFPMGIIQGNAKEDITPWLCGKYINSRFDFENKHGNAFTIYASDYWALQDNVLKKQRIFLFPDSYNAIFGDLILHLQNMIAMGFYVYGIYNEEYIPGKQAYQKRYKQHDFLLIGFDTVLEEFVSVGYLQDGYFQRFSIPFESMRQALKTVKTEKLFLNFFQFHSEAVFRLDLAQTILGISDYLRSTASIQINSQYEIWGMDAMRALTDSFCDSCEKDDSIDIRYTKGLMEHKLYMHMRMEYLFKQSYLTDFSYVENAQQVYKMAETVHMLGLKYNLTGKKTIVSNMQAIMNDMLLTECEYLPSVLAELQKQKGVIT